MTTTEPGPVTLTGNDLVTVINAFTNTPHPHTVHIWFDPIDGGVKFKFNNHTWSPPLGQAAP